MSLTLLNKVQGGINPKCLPRSSWGQCNSKPCLSSILLQHFSCLTQAYELRSWSTKDYKCKCISKSRAINQIRKQILSGLELCGVTGGFLLTVLSMSPRFNNQWWIKDPEGKAIFCLPWMLINPNEAVSLTHTCSVALCVGLSGVRSGLKRP